MKAHSVRVCLVPVRASLLLIGSLVIAAPPGGFVGGGRGAGAAGHAYGGGARSGGPTIVRPPLPGTVPPIGRVPLTNTTGYWSASGFHGPVQPGLSTGSFVGGGGGYRSGTGYHGGQHGTGNGRRGYRGGGGLPWTSYLAPYYYPLLDTADPGDVQYGQYGVPPESGASQDAVMLGNQLGEQLNELSAQVSDLKRAQEQAANGQAAAQNGSPAVNADVDAAPSIPLTLVLRSGQRLTVQNYAIVDGSFWDLGNGAGRKISLDSIDLSASAKATQAAGGEFPVVPGDAGAR